MDYFTLDALAIAAVLLLTIASMSGWLDGRGRPGGVMARPLASFYNTRADDANMVPSDPLDSHIRKDT